MTASQIKLIAIITMVIDHIGFFFFPQYLIFRIIGRVSFPLFAWLIANGAYHTRNSNAYIGRLLLLAFVSQVPYVIANRLVNVSYSSLNIFFTLSIGLGAIILMRKTQMKIHWILIALLSAVLAMVLNTDYGAFGVLSIIAFYLFFKKWNYLILSQISIFIAMSSYFLLNGNTIGMIEIVGLAALAIIYFYNKKEGKKMQYFFYLFYPVHYIIIALLLSLF